MDAEVSHDETSLNRALQDPFLRAPFFTTRTIEGGIFRLEIVAADVAEPEDDPDPAAFIQARISF